MFPVIRLSPKPLKASEIQQLRLFHAPFDISRNHVIYVQHSPADGVYILCDGSIKLTSSIDLNAPRIAGIIRTGEWFGLDSLMPNSRRLFTAVARESSSLCYIEISQFLDVVRGNNEFLWYFVKVLTAGLLDSQKSLIALSGRRVRARLIDAIAESQARSLSLRQVELAGLLGVSAETVNREMRGLRWLATRSSSSLMPNTR